MNQSLAKFKGLEKRFIVWGVVVFVIGLVVLFIGLTASKSVWSSPSDSSGTTYATNDDCLVDFDDCQLSSIPTPNGGAIVFGYVALGLSSSFFGLFMIARFLILTAESIVEGMGGNIQTPLVQKTPTSTIPGATVSDVIRN
jgi:hypothetical protein